LSVFIQFINVVIPVSVLEEKYPGGLDGYARDNGRGTFCCDGHRTRVGFMAPPLAGEFIDKLEQNGLRPREGNRWKDVAVVDQFSRRSTAPCDWIHVGVAPDGRVFACLKEHQDEPGSICVPERLGAKNIVN
jgi:hypothetical protein